MGAESRAKVETSPEPKELSCVSPNMMSSVSPPRVDESPVSRPSIIVSRDTMRPSAPLRTHDFLYKESKRAKLEREKEERRKRREVSSRRAVAAKVFSQDLPPQYFCLVSFFSWD